MAGNTKMREEMVREFIKCLSEETIPWHMAWSTDRPVNAVTNTRYRGINKMWLSFIQKMEGWEDPRWCTFKQASNKGWKIIKGSKGTPVEFWSLYDTQKKKKISYAEARELEENLTPEEYDKRIRLVSRVYSVFNAEQIDGISKYEAKKYDLDTERIMHIRDNLINNMNVGYSEEGDKAFYNPKHDRIVIPEMDRFETEYDYMATLFHEAGHATGHESRFNRQIANMFGSPEYAKEELRAEISSAFTAQAVGITYEQNSHMENHKAYIQSWISALKNNPNELFLAIKDAEKISDYLIEKAEVEKEMSNEKSLTKEMEDYEDEHRRQLENLKRDKTPVVINGYGGPGAGKSTACMEITAALKKAGYGAEYVQEYAKELVYDKNMEMLDGSAKNQFEILKEQTRRVDRLYDQVDFIVTDSPILLNEIYNKELTPEYRDIVGKIQNSYSNFSFFIERDVSNFEEEGRIHNLAESIQKDQEIRDMLLDNDIKYKTYNHENINEIVNDAINYYESYNLMNDRKSEIIRDAEKISMTYSDAATFRMAMKGQKSAIEKFMNDEEIPQYIKNDSMAIGKEIGKYLDEGLGINEIIMKHIHDIDSSCGISNPAYTKKLMVELYSGTREEYESMMRLPDLSKDRTEFDDEQKVSKTVENVKKCVDVKNEMAEMRVPEAEPNIIRDVQKFAFENGYEHIDKIINEGQGFWGKTEKIRNWLMNVVEVNNNEDVRNEARQYLTRLDMLQPKFESQIISEKINNDPLFSISSRDLMEARADSIREKEERIKDTQKKEKQKELKR